MKRFSEQFYTKAKTVKMTVSEKRALRERVVSYMEYHPLSTGSSVPTPYVEEMVVPSFINAKTLNAFKWAVPAVFLFTLVITSAAERAVPGDALYAIKQVNEDLRSTMVRGSYEKVVWETELLNRRIAEARILADEGRLTEAVEFEVAKAVKEHSDNARKEIETLKTEDEDEATLAALEFTTALSVQNSALQNQVVKTGDALSTNLISEVVQVAVETVAQTTEDNNLPSFEKLSAKVERETTRARELLASIADTATPEERSDIDRRLSDIDLKIVTANAEVGTDEIKSREGLIAVLEQTHKLVVFMTNIDVRKTLTVEEVVPVTLTEDERVEKAKGQLAEAQALILQIESLLNATTTETVIEVETRDKVSEAVIMARAGIDKASVALAAETRDVISGEAATLEAYNLTRDAARLLGTLPAEITGEEAQEVTPASEVETLVEEETTASTTTESVVETVSTTTEPSIEADTTTN